ncbi:hypothetical protein D918_08138 [Trichuris suis]|nr:hypothetical protein D918_08138 [Trichuris suis]
MTYRCKTLKLFILDRISNESEKSISGSNNPHVLDAGISSSRSTKEKSSNGWSEECKRKLKCVKKKDHVIVSACVSRQAQHHRYMFQKRRNGKNIQKRKQTQMEIFLPEGTDWNVCKQSKQDQSAPQTEKKTDNAFGIYTADKRSSSLSYGYGVGIFCGQNDTCRCSTISNCDCCIVCFVCSI